MADFYGVLGVPRDRVRRRDQEGVSQARDEVSSGPQQRLEGSRGAVQGDHRGVRRAARSAEARRVRSLRRGGAARRRRRLPPRRPLRSARHLHARLRRLRRTRATVRRRAAGAAVTRAGSRRQDHRAAHARRSGDRRREEDHMQSCSIRATAARASGAEPGSKAQTCARRAAGRARCVARSARSSASS